jgi:hypothetical protein
MPTGTCRYPEHHTGPSAGPPIGLLALIAAGAVIVAYWRTVVVVLVVTGILAVVAAAVVMLIHNHRRYHDPELERQVAALERVGQAIRNSTAAQPHAMPAARPAPALESAPVIHHHLHLHGISADGAAALIARQQLPAAEDTRPW